MAWMTTSEAGKRLGVSENRVRQYIEAGRLTVKKFGRAYMVSEKSVEAFERLKPGRPRTHDKTDPKPSQAKRKPRGK